jgi:hypothetical protein
MILGYLPLYHKGAIKPAFLILILIFFVCLLWTNFISKEYLKAMTFLCSIITSIEGFFGIIKGFDGYTVLNK